MKMIGSVEGFIISVYLSSINNFRDIWLWTLLLGELQYQNNAHFGLTWGQPSFVNHNFHQVTLELHGEVGRMWQLLWTQEWQQYTGRVCENLQLKIKLFECNKWFHLKSFDCNLRPKYSNETQGTTNARRPAIAVATDVHDCNYLAYVHK